MILGLGTDILEISRLAISIQRSGDSFLKHVYAQEELDKAPPKGPRRLEYLAGRWAAKEAFSKALGTGIVAKCRMQEIIITNQENGAPNLNLAGAAAETAQEKGVKKIHLSISHEKNYACAVVILED